MTSHDEPLYRCAACGYDLSGLPAEDNPEPTCPECGASNLWQPYMPKRPTTEQRWAAVALALAPSVLNALLVHLSFPLGTLSAAAFTIPPFFALGLTIFLLRLDPRIALGSIIGAAAPALILTILVCSIDMHVIVLCFAVAAYWFLGPIAGSALGAEAARGMLGID